MVHELNESGRELRLLVYCLEQELVAGLIEGQELGIKVEPVEIESLPDEGLDDLVGHTG
jgi:hypothetical protein